MQTQESITVQKTREYKARFLLYLPEGYRDKLDIKWPLLIFLHGAGERGDDLNKVKVHGPPNLIEKGIKFPFVVIKDLDEFYRPYLDKGINLSVINLKDRMKKDIVKF